MSGEYSVDELLQQRANILQEIADNEEDVSNSSARWVVIVGVVETLQWIMKWSFMSSCKKLKLN